MKGPGSKREPTFLWQGLLIVLPVAVLAAVGFYSLRTDRILAEHDAAERAQAIADDLLPKISVELAPDQDPEALSHRSFEVDQHGELIFPAPLPPPPAPHPFNLAELTPGQARLWHAAQWADATEPGSNLAPAIEAGRQFIDSRPPEQFTAAMHYTMGLLLSRNGNRQAAAELFGVVLAKYPDSLGESGLPLRPLAEFKLLELGDGRTNAVSLSNFCSNAVYFPTPLTEHLLALVEQHADTPQPREECRKWQRTWQEHELLRQLFSALRDQFPVDARLAASPLLSRTENVQKGAELKESVFPAAGSSGVAMAGIRWVNLAKPWRTFVTNFTSVTTNGIPMLSAIETEESHWLIYPENALPSLLAPNLEETLRTMSRARFSQSDTTKPNKNAETFFGDIPAREASGARTSRWFFCRSEAELGSIVTRVVRDAKQIPIYFGIGVEIAGQNILRSAPDLRLWHEEGYIGRKGGGVKPQYSGGVATKILATAGRQEAGTAALRTSVYLTSPSVLYKRQAARTFWFGSLVAVAVFAALMGLVAAWRAFHSQSQLSEMKSDFVSSVSHELRAPIASVRLLAESLERGTVQTAEKQGDYFHLIGQECRRLSSMIENVLDFSRIEQGRKQYEFEPTDLIALVEQTVKLMEPYVAERQVTLAMKLPANHAAENRLQASVDGKAIQQALVNLIDNAVKHTPGGGEVIVRLEGGGTTRLSVEDRGPGIPAEEHGRIFDRFYRRGSELRRETQGIGIGLAIVKHIVEAHGGRIELRSAVGEGSRFTIELPNRAMDDA